jgi:putative ABC transport system ATP-binding protein
VDQYFQTGKPIEKPIETPSLPIIALRNLTKTYELEGNQVYALRGVSLDIWHGEMVMIMGPSGSGKSTLMNLIGCLDRPTGGDYLLEGIRVSHMTPDALADVRNQYIGFVFQGFKLLKRSTALVNVMLPLMYAGFSRQEQERRATSALQMVGLGERLDHAPAQLSGGQQQRVAIARALVNQPLLLLADEPTGNLDSRTSLEIMAMLQELNEHGITIVMVTHNPEVTIYAKRVVTVRDGNIVRDELIKDRRSAAVDWQAIQSEHEEQVR